MTPAPPPTAEAASSPGAPWSRPSVVVLGVVLMVGMWLGWLSRDAALTVYGDDTTYLTLSYEIATGQYRDSFLVGAPPHAQYPPGMPLWLLLVRVLAGPSLDAVLAGNLLLVALTALLVADGVRRVATPWLGVTVAAMILFNAPLFVLVAELRSEIPFLALAALALWWSLKDSERTAPGALTWLALAAALAAFLTRSAGLALFPAVFGAMLLRRRWQALIAGGTMTLAVVVAWFSYTRWAAAQTVGHSYATDLAAGVSSASAPLLIEHLAANAKMYILHLANAQFSIPDLPEQPLDNLLVGLFLAVPAAIGAWQVRKRWPALGLFLLGSVAILLAFSWPIRRLFTPLIPWVAAAMLLGWSGLAAAAGVRRPHRVAVGLGLVLASLGLIHRAQAAVREQGCRDSPPFVDPACYEVQYRSYASAVQYIRDSLPNTAVIAAVRPAFVHLSTDRLTMPIDLFERSAFEGLVAPQGPTTHILLSKLYRLERRLGEGRLRDVCGSLALLKRYPAGTLLFEVRPSPTADLNACDALDRYVQDRSDSLQTIP